MVQIDTSKTVFEKTSISTDNKPTDFICQLDSKDQHVIKLALVTQLANTMSPRSKEFEELLDAGMNGRLCDIEDTLDIHYMGDTTSESPSCFSPNDSAYPLCIGNGQPECQKCCLFENMDDEGGLTYRREVPL